MPGQFRPQADPSRNARELVVAFAISLGDQVSAPAVEDLWKRAYPDYKPPPDRTLRRWIEPYRKRSGEPWRLTTESAATDAIVMAVWVAAFERTEGRVRYLTEDEAAWVRTLHSLAPSLSHHNLYQLARRYVAWEQVEASKGTGKAGEERANLDLMLAYLVASGPDASLDRWFGAMAAGLVPLQFAPINVWSGDDAAASRADAPALEMDPPERTGDALDGSQGREGMRAQEGTSP